MLEPWFGHVRFRCPFDQGLHAHSVVFFMLFLAIFLVDLYKRNVCFEVVVAHFPKMNRYLTIELHGNACNVTDFR